MKTLRANEWTGATSLAIAALIPRLDGKTWLILWLVGTIGVLLEALYRVTKQRDSVLRKLRHKEKNQGLSRVDPVPPPPHQDEQKG